MFSEHVFNSKHSHCKYLFTDHKSMKIVLIHCSLSRKKTTKIAVTCCWRCILGVFFFLTLYNIIFAKNRQQWQNLKDFKKRTKQLSSHLVLNSMKPFRLPECCLLQNELNWVFCHHTSCLPKKIKQISMTARILKKMICSYLKIPLCLYITLALCMVWLFLLNTSYPLWNISKLGNTCLKFWTTVFIHNCQSSTNLNKKNKQTERSYKTRIDQLNSIVSKSSTGRLKQQPSNWKYIEWLHCAVHFATKRTMAAHKAV